MDGKRVLITTTAAWQVIVGRLQSDEQRLSVNLGIRFYRESFPEQGKRISIHRDGGESVRFVVLANSKLTGFTAVSYCFTLTRDEPFLLSASQMARPALCRPGFSRYTCSTIRFIIAARLRPCSAGSATSMVSPTCPGSPVSKRWSSSNQPGALDKPGNTKPGRTEARLGSPCSSSGSVSSSC